MHVRVPSQKFFFFRHGCEGMAMAFAVATTASFISLVSVAMNRYLLVALPKVGYTGSQYYSQQTIILLTTGS